ncbi:dihydropyrimidinase [Ruminococcaceae bacterium OttesenSCG-928-O06]|nr:dihydropyrimidinase [Ruminococcaceae bacterium OttesenSCG-928-O06]
MQNLLIHNATIATSSEVFRGGVLVEGEKVARLYREGEALPSPTEASRFDAGGHLLLPGGVDAHTHFDLDVGFTRASDDFYTGTVAAALGGTTTVIDHMAFGPPGCALCHQPAVYHRLAQRAVVDYGFHGVVQHVNDEVLADMARLRDDEGISSVKVYLTYDYKLEDADVLRVLQRAKELGLTVCVHCENDAAITALRAQYVREGHTQARYHPLSRPAAAEAEAVFRTLMLAHIAGDAHIYIVHLSSKRGLAALQLARAEGQKNITAETCPQYLSLTDEKYDDDAEGLKYIMSPPLRKPADVDALWQALAAGEVDTIGTDHCPFFFATQKQRGAGDFTQCPNGAPGVELRMALLFSEGVRAGRISLPQMVRCCCTTPARVFGAAPAKGDIVPGADADFVLFDPDAEWTVRAEDLHENVDYTPYEGMRLRGRPTHTFSRGQLIAEHGVFLGNEGRGRYLRRTAHPV